MASFAIILSISAGYTLYLVRLDSALQKVAAEHNYLLGQASSMFNAELGDVRQSTILLDTHLQDLLGNTNVRAIVNNALQRVGEGHAALSQIRWLSTDGVEQYRVDFEGNNKIVIPAESLQDKSQRYYFQQALDLAPGEMLLSPIDLNVENGQVQTPYVPTVRGILRANDDHPMGDGYLIVNIALTELFKQLKSLSNEQARLLIASGEDRWILHYKDFKEWAPDLNAPAHNLKTDKPQLFQTLATRPAVALFRDSENDVYSGHTLHLNTGTKRQRTTLYFLAKTPGNVFSRLHREAVFPALGLAFLILIGGGLLFTRELRNKLSQETLSRQLEKDKKELATSLEQQKLLQDELVEAEKMASLGILVAGVSHELSTPVGGAVMSVSSIQQRTQEIIKKLDKGLSKRELEEFLEHSRQSSQLALDNLGRSGDLIKRFKRLAVDRGNEESASFDLAGSIDDLVRSLGPLLKKRQAQINVTVPQHITMVSFPGVLSQVLQNLITNCIDHAVTEQKHLHIYLNATVQSGQATITVRDNGSGVSESVRQRIFEPFITTSRSEGNTGLGLHLVHQWVNMVFEGQISFDSSNEGTMFILCIPQNISAT